MLDEVLVPLSGPINGVSAREVQDQLMHQVEAGVTRLTVDLQDVTAIDSAGLGVFVTVFKQLQKRGGQLELANASENVVGIFEQTHLDKLFVINGMTAAERQKAEEEAARHEAATAHAAHAPAAPGQRPRAEAAPDRAGSGRPTYLYAALLLALALLGFTQYMFHQRFTDDDLLPYLRSNAAIVRSVLMDARRTLHKVPASGEEVQKLVQQKGINFRNVYTREPQRIADGVKGAPGDLLYEPNGNGFRLRAVTRDGSLLKEGPGEFVLTESKRK